MSRWQVSGWKQLFQYLLRFFCRYFSIAAQPGYTQQMWETDNGTAVLNRFLPAVILSKKKPVFKFSNLKFHYFSHGLYAAYFHFYQITAGG